jgi:predicted permease
MSLRTLVDSMAQDARYAARGLRARPGFTLIVAGTLALGIGANSSMFSIVDRLVLRAPDQIRDPDQVVQVVSRYRGNRGVQVTWPYASYTDFRDHVQAFANVAAVTSGGRQDFPLGRGADATRVAGALVTASFFTTLGVTPALGRFFLPEDDQEANPARSAVIGYGFWQRHFGGRADALGTPLAIGTTRYTIVGVAPRGFSGIELAETDVWLTLGEAEGLRFDRRPEWRTNRNSQWLAIVARVRPGVVIARATTEATLALRAGEEEKAAQNPSGRSFAPDSLDAVLSSLVPGKSVARVGIGGTAHGVQIAELLMAVAVVVLLIACANVTNLLLARALARRREIAVRLAVGVGQGRLVRQLLIEGGMLAAIGAVASLAVAYWGAGFARVLLLGNAAWSGSPIDLRMIVFTGAVALGAGIATSLAPAWYARRTDLATALKQGAREGAVERSALRSGLLAVQAALAIVLLAGAGLFIRSVRNADALPLGIDVDHVLVADVKLATIGVANDDMRRLYEEFASRVRQVPGVTASAVSLGLPFTLNLGTTIIVPGRELPRLHSSGDVQYVVTPGYFESLGIPVRAGRAFTPDDRAGMEPVAVINETVAQLYFPDRSPLGACIKVGADTMPCSTIVGVVANTRRSSVLEGLVPQVYRPLDQVPASEIARTLSFFGFTLVAHTRGDARLSAEAVRRAIQSTSALVPYANVRPMRAQFSGQTRAWTLGAAVFTAFGALALLLAAIGLYSVLSFSIAQRWQELGVRAALGAQSRDLFRLTLVRGLVPVVGGIVAGVAIALGAGRVVASLLLDVSPSDPVVLGTVSLVLLVVATAASAAPAWRATRVDPADALRGE